jgi:hypothetical protein
VDAAWWRTISQLALLGGLLVAALGGAGAWYFSRQLETAKDRQAEAEREQLSEQVAGLQRASQDMQQENMNLLTRLEPFERLALERFPEAPPDDALERLRTELTAPKEPPPRITPRPPRMSIRDRVIANLKALSGRPQPLGLHLHNTTSRSVVEFVFQLQSILKEAGIPYQVLTLTDTSIINPSPPPYSIAYAPSAAEVASQLSEALTPFLGAPAQIMESPNLPAGRVDITIAGHPDLNEDGSVTIR